MAQLPNRVMRLVARSAAGADLAAEALRQAVESVDPALPARRAARLDPVEALRVE
jgi:hypothetical protein